MHSWRKDIYKSNLKVWARGETKNHCVRGTVFYENITTKRLKVLICMYYWVFPRRYLPHLPYNGWVIMGSHMYLERGIPLTAY